MGNTAKTVNPVGIGKVSNMTRKCIMRPARGIVGVRIDSIVDRVRCSPRDPKDEVGAVWPILTFYHVSCFLRFFVKCFGLGIADDTRDTRFIAWVSDHHIWTMR